MTIETDTIKKDVFIQDQTSPAFEHYLYEILNAVVIANNSAKGANQLTLSGGHNFVDPLNFAVDYIVIHYIDQDQPTDALKYRFYQGRVIDVTANVIDLGIHIPFAIDTTKIDAAWRVNTNMALAVGTFANPVRFFTTPVNGIKLDMTRVMIDMIATAEADDGKFGGGTPLVNGMFFGFEGDNFTEYLVNIIDNGGFRSTAFDVNYTARTVPAGSYGVSTRKTFSGQDKYGVTIRLDGSAHDQFVAYIQDDMTLSARELDRLRIKAMGHLVVD